MFASGKAAIADVVRVGGGRFRDRRAELGVAATEPAGKALVGVNGGVGKLALKILVLGDEADAGLEHGVLLKWVRT